MRNLHIGFIFQSFNLIGDLSVYENVELPLTYRGMPAHERKERVERALERVGMSHRVRHMRVRWTARPSTSYKLLCGEDSWPGWNDRLRTTRGPPQPLDS